MGFKTALMLLTRGACKFVPKVEEDYKTTLSVVEFKESGKESFEDRFTKGVDFDEELFIDKPTLAYLSKTNTTNTNHHTCL